MELYIIRHGETAHNRMGIVQGSGIDSDLNEKGLEQAEMFFRAYRNFDFDFIYTSRLKRSYQTVKAFIDKKNIPFESTALINEISWGDHEGRKATPEMISNYNKMVEQWNIGNFDASLPNAESAGQLSQRLSQFLELIKVRDHKQILICTHGRTLRCLLCLMKGQHLSEMEKYTHHNTGLFRASYQNGTFDFRLENDTSHLIPDSQNFLKI